MSQLYLEILDAERLKIFNKLSAFSPLGFLAGGTALALQIGHRKSFDFDVFLPKSLSAKFYQKVLNVFGQETKTRLRTGDLLLVQTREEIEIHFVYYWYKNLQPLIKTSSISLCSVADIAANKAFTIGQRGQWRDYVDIFFLMKKEIFSLDKIVELTQYKYQSEFNRRLFLQQLVYFKDIENFDTAFLKEVYSVSQIQYFLEKVTKEYLKKLR